MIYFCLFQLENSNKLSDVLALEKSEIERKEVSEKYEREISRSQELAQNVSTYHSRPKMEK